MYDHRLDRIRFNRGVYRQQDRKQFRRRHYYGHRIRGNRGCRGRVAICVFGAEGVNGFNLYSMFVAVIGAIVVLVIYHALTGRRAIT